MRRLSLIQLTLVVSMLGAIAPTSWAQPFPTSDDLATQSTPSPVVSTPTATASPITLGTDTALVVQFPIALTLAIDEGQPYPISLPLVQAILDDQGNVLVPAQTPVGIQLQPQDGGVRLVAESLVVNGQLIPIVGSGSIIPGTTVTYEDAYETAQTSSTTFSNLFANTAGLLTNGDPSSYTQGGMLGSIIGTIAGMQSPETARVVQIPKDATYVLSLDTPATF